MSLVSMFVAPVAGRLSDRIGGKYILVAGLSLFSLGMAAVIWSAHPDSTTAQLLPGLVIAGLGMGMTFAPLQTVAMRNIEPRMAGAAAGLINTTRQLGAVLGSAAVGALLQNQIAVKLAEAAQRNASALPEQFRGQFLHGFESVSGGNLEVGAGQTGTKLPPGVPEQVKEVFTRTFEEGFTAAMRTSLILPIAVLVLAALSCLLIKRRRPGTPAEPGGAAASDAAPAQVAA
jgi:MFS family permease